MPPTGFPRPVGGLAPFMVDLVLLWLSARCHQDRAQFDSAGGRMVAFRVPVLRSLVLPSGATSGQRIVIDGDAGCIIMYNSSNAISGEWCASSQGFSLNQGGFTFLVNPKGVFFYNGTPGLGTLAASIYNGNAVSTDTFGNPVYPGMISYVPGSDTLMTGTFATQGVSGTGQFVGNANPGAYDVGVIRALLTSPDNHGAWYFQNPGGTAGDTAFGSFYLMGGQGYVQTPRQFSTCYAYFVDTPITPRDPNNLVPETWHNIPVTLSGWANRTGTFPLQVRLLASPSYSIQLQGDITGTALAAGTATIGTMPSVDYAPSAHASVAIPIVTVGVTTAPTNPPNVVVTTTGAIQIRNATGATELQINAIIPLNGNP